LDKELSFLSYSPEVTVLPPVSFYFNSRLLEAISIPRKSDDQELSLDFELSTGITDDLAPHLRLIDARLINVWNGAKEAIKSTNPDAVRHFSVSLRELLTQLIHILSPDEDIKKWSTSPDHFAKNRPTRRARLLYIFRAISSEPFHDFVDKDIDALLAFMDLFQEGTHSIAPPFSEEQLSLLLMRAESVIRFLVWASRSLTDN
jgi:hypothetical protein